MALHDLLAIAGHTPWLRPGQEHLVWSQALASNGGRKHLSRAFRAISKSVDVLTHIRIDITAIARDLSSMQKPDLKNHHALTLSNAECLLRLVLNCDCHGHDPATPA